MTSILARCSMVAFAAIVGALFATQAPADEGQQVYNDTCATCHADGVQGAPRSGNADDWNDRIDKGEEELFDNAINGFTGDEGTMPPRGGNSDLSDDEVKSAVRYMIDRVD